MTPARSATAARNSEFARAERAAKFILSKTKLRPKIALVLGSGLGAFADELAGAAKIPYQKIPGFPHSTAVGHAGQLVIGKVGSVEAAVMQGRVHFYEGYTAKEVVFPMRVLGRLGIRTAILTNAAGGIDLGYKQGALVVIRDHINLQGANPLIGPNDERFGPRFPDMTQAYWKQYRAIALAESKRLGMEVHEGVYAALSGPSYETPAEIRYLKTIGADLVGMSTVPEVIVGVHAGLRNLGLSVITDLCLPDALEPVKLEHILATAAAAEKKLRVLVRRVVGELP